MPHLDTTNVYFVASLWMALALAASIISIRLSISVALAEIGVGVIGGNVLHLHTTTWIDFLASFGSGLLTFLAGAEIDPSAVTSGRRSPPVRCLSRCPAWAPSSSASWCPTGPYTPPRSAGSPSRPPPSPSSTP